MQGERLDPMDLPEAAAWRAAFDGSPGLFEFISQRVSPTVASAVAHMLWPRFVMQRGCVLIRERFDPESFEQWWDQLAGDVASIEGVVNHLHLWDLFDVDSDDPMLARATRELAELIASTWRCALVQTFPHRRFEVTVSDDATEYGPTVSFRSVWAPAGESA